MKISHCRKAKIKIRGRRKKCISYVRSREDDSSCDIDHRCFREASMTRHHENQSNYNSKQEQTRSQKHG